MSERSAEADAYHRWYGLAIWCGKHGLRAKQLKRQPMCERCAKRGRIRAADVVNHRDAHRGDWKKFIDPKNHESLCKWHHDSEAQRVDLGQSIVEFGADGWPIEQIPPLPNKLGGLRP